MSPAHKVRRYFIVVCLASIVFLAGLSWQLLTRWDVIRFSPARAKEATLGVHGHTATATGTSRVVDVDVDGQALKLVAEERRQLLPGLASDTAPRKLAPTSLGRFPANDQRVLEAVGGGGGRGGGGQRGGRGGGGRGGSGPEGARRSGKSVVMEQDADSGGRDQAAEEGSRTHHEGPREGLVADSGDTRSAASVDRKGGGGAGSLARTHNADSVGLKGGGGSVATTRNAVSADMKGGGGGSVDTAHGAGSWIKTHKAGSVDTTDDAGSLAKTHNTGSLSKPRDAGSAAGSRNPPSKPGPAKEPEPDRQEPEPDKPEAEAGKGEAEDLHHDSHRPENHRHSGENVGAGFEPASQQSGRESGAGRGGFQQGGARGRVPETRRGTDSGTRPPDKILRQSRLGASGLGADEAADLQQKHNDDFQRRGDTRNDLNGAANGFHNTGEKPDRSRNLGEEAKRRADGLTDRDSASDNRGPGEQAGLSRNLGEETERRREGLTGHDDKPRAREEKTFPLHPTPVLPAAGTRAKALSKTDDGEGEGFHDNQIHKRPDPLRPRSEKRKPAAVKETDDDHDAGLRRQPSKPQAPEESSNSGSRQSYDEQRRAADFTHGAGGSGGSNRLASWDLGVRACFVLEPQHGS